MKAFAITLGASAMVLAAASSAQAGHHCVRASGVGEAVTKELAAANAKEQLANDLTGHGLKARGHMHMHCKYEGVVTMCKASTRACK